jgi:hypothetical protein
MTANKPTTTTAHESPDTEPRQQRLEGLEINAASASVDGGCLAGYIDTADTSTAATVPVEQHAGDTYLVIELADDQRRFETGVTLDSGDAQHLADQLISSAESDQ